MKVEHERKHERSIPSSAFVSLFMELFLTTALCKLLESRKENFCARQCIVSEAKEVMRPGMTTPESVMPSSCVLFEH